LVWPLAVECDRRDNPIARIYELFRFGVEFVPGVVDDTHHPLESGSHGRGRD
jgi:hypothetical protein